MLYEGFLAEMLQGRKQIFFSHLQQLHHHICIGEFSLSCITKPKKGMEYLQNRLWERGKVKT